MKYVLATVQIADQERQYYAGPKRKNVGPRIALRTTPLINDATAFDTREDAEAMRKDLDDGYIVIERDSP